jgi:serine/threonine protein kinase
MPLAVGTRLGNYEIVGLLGKGGMGEVYRGKDTKSNGMLPLRFCPSRSRKIPNGWPVLSAKPRC